MKTTLLSWLARLAQVVLAFVVALPVYLVAVAARRLLRRRGLRASKTRGQV